MSTWEAGEGGVLSSCSISFVTGPCLQAAQRNVAALNNNTSVWAQVPFKRVFNECKFTLHVKYFKDYVAPKVIELPLVSREGSGFPRTCSESREHNPKFSGFSWEPFA